MQAEAHPCIPDYLVAVIEQIAAGLTNEQVGRRLGLSPHTVATYIADARLRLGASDRAELVARCFVIGLLSVDAWPPRRSGRCRRQGA
jgi:DNA-binding CsgD family transcriptional regulator